MKKKQSLNFTSKIKEIELLYKSFELTSSFSTYIAAMDSLNSTDAIVKIIVY